ncbi:hypothetical protein GMD78_12935 [Ornithinibacillus sp. L9]|uniref:Uncharacterized protein n=1 Tax=Ornithinibacillus caprae TaxID=2678566 RepID=A0A6N8FMN6_9BACI|nr:hypothetical protein [Ornithinibacillus caprae]MUK89277.1 hypothetical protein [Ornithinibacillus caprae]
MLETSYESLKTNLIKHDLTKSVQQLMLLYLEDSESFIRNILLSEVLFEPITLGVKEKDIQFMNRVFITAFKVIEENSMEEKYNNFVKESTSLINSINIIYQAIKENNELLLKNEFLEIPFKKQVQMYCTFIESQAMYAHRNLKDKMNQKKYLTGLEEVVTEDGKKHSVSDNLEAIIDLFDTLIRLLHYNSKGKIDGQLHNTYSDVSPYLIPSLEMIMHLTSHKQTLDILWEKIKYRDWNFLRYKSQGGNVFYYVPRNDYNFKL